MALEKWSFDPVHSSINFWVRHLMVSKVHGHFSKWTGTMEFDEKNPAASKIEIQIDAASIDTREAQRDAHLRSADFFETEKFPQLTFKSTAVKSVGDGFQATGDLTIKGVTKPVVLEVEYSGRVKDPWGGERAGFSAHTSLHRKDFGLTWNQALEAGGIAVGDKIEINIEVEAIRKAETAAATTTETRA